MNWCQEDGFLSIDTQTDAIRIDGTNFLHYWVTDSIEHVESLITTYVIAHGGLFRALASFTTVLHDSFIAYGLLLLGPVTHES